MSELSYLALPHVVAIHADTPGLQPTEPGWINLNTNECPYPPSPSRAAAILLGSRSATLPTATEAPTADPNAFDLVTWLVILDGNMD